MWSKRICSIAVAALTIAGASIGVLRADTLYVNDETGNDAWDGRCKVWDGKTCGPKKTIQAGIDAAKDGDEVLVADGVYTGDGNRDIDFRGKLILVRSENGAENCIIDCQGSANDPHRGFYFHSGETPSARLEGFTIQNGYVNNDNPGSARGGGIYCRGSSPTISDCIIRWNVGGGSNPFGGGIACLSSDPTIVNCMILENNVKDYDSFPRGGGIYADQSSSPTIVSSTIAGNRTFSSHGSWGGGIYCGGDTKVIGCVIKGNSARQGSGGGIMCFGGRPTIAGCTIMLNVTDIGVGGGISAYDSAPTVVDCEIIANTASFAGGAISTEGDSTSITISNCRISANRSSNGGGVACRDGSQMRLTNCELTDNRVDGEWARSGGAIQCWGGSRSPSTVLLTNCTIAENSAPTGRMLACNSIGGSNPGIVRLTNCISWNGGDEIINEDGTTITILNSNIEDGWPGKGNIDADPLFVDPANGDYHLLPDSPCIDTGDPEFVPQPGQTDMDNQMRLWDGDNDGVRRVDMGADEFASHVFGDLNCDGSLDLIDVEPFVLALIDETAYEQRYSDCEKLLGDANFDGSLDLTDVEPFIELLLR